jgi:hypothetical protein
MSIVNEIKSLRDQGVLYHLIPVEPGRSVERDVFVSRNIWGLLEGEDADVKLQQVGARARRRLESFACGRAVVFGMNPLLKDRTSLIARNDPTSTGVVDVRINDPKPAVRLFGCFAERNVLVLLLRRTRSDLALKGFSSSIRQCRRDWDMLFPSYAPLISEDPNEYITGTFDLG